MNVKTLRAYRAVMTFGSLTRAAEHLNLSQPAMSRLINRLEDEIRITLFSRHRRQLTPTEEGEIFFRESEHILADLEAITTIAEDVRNRVGAYLKIFAMPNLAHSLVPEALSELVRLHPSLRYSLDIPARSDMERRIAGKQYDIGLAILPVEHASIRCEKFLSSAAVVALPPNHPLTARKKLVPADLDGEPFIAMMANTRMRREVDQVVTETGITLNIRTETTSSVMACQLVAGGLGISIVGPLIPPAYKNGLIEIREFEPQILLEYGLIYPNDRTPLPIARQFGEIVAKAANGVRLGSWRAP
ncbi:MAG: LysR family transcriptional regulator [Rhodospirillales bacterium]